MGFSGFPNSILVLLFALFNLLDLGVGARKLASLYQPPAMAISYHNGALLEGDVPVSVLWYGNFTAPQKAIVADFLLSLNPLAPVGHVAAAAAAAAAPSVSRWWSTVQVC